MASKTIAQFAEDHARRWDSEAFRLEQQAKDAPSAIEKRLMEMHGRVKRACAQELRLAANRHGG